MYREIADRLTDRLDDVSRTFSSVLILGSRAGYTGQLLRARYPAARIIQSDLAAPLAARAQATNGIPAISCDEEALPFAAESFDLIIAAGGLHWVNDLPGCLLQIRHCLRPDGLFLGAMIGGESLAEMTAAFTDAELVLRDGLSPRFSPTIDLRDAAALLQRAGFALPVADGDSVTVQHSSLFALMKDLRAMAETNCHSRRERGMPPRQLFIDAAARLQAGQDHIRTRFDLLLLAGWAPAESQQKPLRPGSAARSLTEALIG